MYQLQTQKENNLRKAFAGTPSIKSRTQNLFSSQNKRYPSEKPPGMLSYFSGADPFFQYHINPQKKGSVKIKPL